MTDDGSTSSMVKHLRETHAVSDPRAAAEALGLLGTPSLRQATLSGGGGGGGGAAVVAGIDERNKELRRLLVAWLAGAELPFHATEHSLFRLFLSALKPGFADSLPGSDQLMRTDLPALYRNVSDHVTRALKDATGPLCWSSDGWTMKHGTSSYLMTGVFFLKDWTLSSVCLSVKHFAEGHSADAMAKHLRETFLANSIQQRAFVGITDNASAMQKLGIDKIRCMWLPCIAHTLNLIVSDAVNAADQQLGDLFALLGSLVKFFHKSPTASTALQQAIEQNRKDVSTRLSKFEPLRDSAKALPKKLKTRAPTRWNSLVDMLRRFYVLLPAVCVALMQPGVCIFLVSFA